MTVHDLTSTGVRLVADDISPALSRAATQAGIAAFDTETTGLDWRQARLCLIQVHVPDAGTEIVRVGDASPSRLLELLQDQRTSVVFHHAAFDLRFIAAKYGVRAAAVRCTKVAAKLLHPAEPERQKLAALTKEYLGVTLNKSEQTSDWSASQLSERQITYAARDVAHLAELLAAITSRLQDQGLLELAEACWRHLPTRVELDMRGYSDVFTY